jgi:hypothetical protein
MDPAIEGLQLGANKDQCRNECDRENTRDKTIFDGRRTSLIRYEARQNGLHEVFTPGSDDILWFPLSSRSELGAQPQNQSLLVKKLATHRRTGPFGHMA